MRTPRFTAERSLYQPSAHYRGTATFGQAEGTVHLAQDPDCFANCQDSCVPGCLELTGVARGQCLRRCRDECLEACPPGPPPPPPPSSPLQQCFNQCFSACVSDYGWIVGCFQACSSCCITKVSTPHCRQDPSTSDPRCQICGGLLCEDGPLLLDGQFEFLATISHTC